MSVGRNDLCPCGSGKKYKRCCMVRDKVEQAERMAWERAAQDMRVALTGYAKEIEFVKDLAAGLGLFWQDRYTTETVHMMSVDESLRFFDWFAHDYRMQYLDEGSSDLGKRLVEIYRQRMDEALSDKERAILDGWIDALPGSAFILEEADPEQGTVVLHDLFIPDRLITVSDSAAATHGELGQILLARPLPGHERVQLAGATVVLPASEVDPLQAFVMDALQPGGDETPVEEKADLERIACLRSHAHLLTHYALEWADRQGRHAVSADDPEARKPGGQAVRKLIRWSSEQVRSR